MLRLSELLNFEIRPGRAQIIDARNFPSKEGSLPGLISCLVFNKLGEFAGDIGFGVTVFMFSILGFTFRHDGYCRIFHGCNPDDGVILVAQLVYSCNDIFRFDAGLDHAIDGFDPPLSASC